MVPPFTVVVIDPSEPLRHLTFDGVVAVLSDADGCVIITDAIVLHPFKSVTVTVYVPEITLLRFCVVVALLHK